MSLFQISPTEEPYGVRLEGEIDLATAPRLEEALRFACRHMEPLTIDMRDLTFIDSTALHVLVRVAQSLNGGGPMILLDPPPHIARVMAIVGFGTVPEIEIRNGPQDG